MNSKLKVAFDVDGTLISIKDDKPRHEIIDAFRLFERLGCEMFIWSGGGIDYAEMVARKLGLSAQIVEKFSFQPDISFDDMDVTKAKVSIKV